MDRCTHLVLCRPSKFRMSSSYRTKAACLCAGWGAFREQAGSLGLLRAATRAGTDRSSLGLSLY